MNNETILHFHDKSTYQLGPWIDEPDKVVWKDTETNLDCMIRRNHFGVWCGYVGVPQEHPTYGKPYYNNNEEDEKYDPIQEYINNIEVHGGLTFSSPCSTDEDEMGICHKSDKAVYWFGFDCAHYGDYLPFFDMMKGFIPPSSIRYEIYRDMAYAKAEVLSLAKQLNGIS